MPVLLYTAEVFANDFTGFDSHLQGFNMIFHSTLSGGYLWYLILVGEQKKRKSKTRIQSSS